MSQLFGDGMELVLLAGNFQRPREWRGCLVHSRGGRPSIHLYLPTFCRLKHQQFSKESEPVSRENTPRDKKLEHAEDLERMSRILKRQSEEAKALKNKEPECPKPQPFRHTGM